MKKRKTIKKECKHCGKEFNADFYAIKKGYGNYCSKACSNKGNKLGYKKGYKHTKDAINKIKEKRKLQIICHSKATREKMSKKAIEQHRCPPIFYKEKHWNWKGGKQRNNHNGDCRYKKWRTLVFKRDNFSCCLCHKIGGTLNAHHIKKWSEYPKLRYSINNGITLCLSCHKLIHQKQ